MNAKHLDRRGALMMLALAGSAAAAGASQDAAGEQRPAQTVLVLLLRHGEKSADDPQDPSLSRTGQIRAAALATMLEKSGVTHLFASEYKRTQQTLAPLAEKIGVTAQMRPASKVDDLARELVGLPAGSVVVVAGHSNTIPALAKALGGSLTRLERHGAVDVLPDLEYGRVAALAVPACEGAAPRVLELHVGD